MKRRVRPSRPSRPAHENAATTGVGPLPLSPRRIATSFRELLSGGAKLKPAGDARRDPEGLLARYVPRHCVELFETSFFLTDFRFDDNINFLVAYVAPREASGRIRAVYPRIFYKDSSLVWRVASHLIGTEDENWIGKGDVKWESRPDGEYLLSAEETTNLPYELQPALDTVSRTKKRKRDDEATALVLRRGPSNRIQAYGDFTEPRRRASAAGALNRGRPVVRIARRNDPSSLRFARDFEPDFGRGLLEVTESGSHLYGGVVQKHRIRSVNGLVQYQFVSSPTHVWVNPPQALTTELTTYGVRALDVAADEDVFVPGYEYHYVDDTLDPPELHSQIPPGFAGEASEVDPARADASAWIERLPVVREFRRRVLGERRRG